MKKYDIQTNPFNVPTEDGKIIKEHFGLSSINNPSLSLAFMIAPAGWKEPYQTPEFDEYTLIISGKKQIIIDSKTIVLEEGQSIKIKKGCKIQYSNPFTEPCKYVSICTPAFSIDTVNREDQ